MSEYSLYDFTESLDRGFESKDPKPVSFVKAWGRQGNCAEWEGGFVLRFGDGTYAYLSGWCDTTGWGCQDGVDVRLADSIEGLDLPVDVEWDEHPADLNIWLEKGSPDPYSL